METLNRIQKVNQELIEFELLYLLKAYKDLPQEFLILKHYLETRKIIDVHYIFGNTGTKWKVAHSTMELKEVLSRIKDNIIYIVTNFYRSSLPIPYILPYVYSNINGPALEITDKKLKDKFYLTCNPFSYQLEITHDTGIFDTEPGIMESRIYKGNFIANLIKDSYISR